MKRYIPHPLLSLALLLMWLLLTAFSLGHLVLGSLIALAAGKLFAAFEPEPVRMRRVWKLVWLMAITAVDIARSNIAVASLILSNGRHGKRRSAFVEIPLRLTSPHALALLSMIITATPGTAWLSHDMETGMLTLHVFDKVDDDDWRDLIRNRYEAILLEVFE